MIDLNQAGMGQSTVLTNLMLGMKNGSMVAEKLFPRLNSVMTSMMLARMGDTSHRRYNNLKRPPGAKIKRVEINFEGKKYKIEQYAVDVPIPVEIIEEIIAVGKLTQAMQMKIDSIAISTGYNVLALDYEAEAGEIATNAANYAAGNTEALTGAAKWSAANSTPKNDIADAKEIIRKKIGVRPNCLLLSASTFEKVSQHPQVIASLASTINHGAASIEQLQTILNVPNIFIGDAIVKTGNETSDVWGDNAILYYAPDSLMNQTAFGDVSLTEPAFGFTGTKDNGITVRPPAYERKTESWIYGCKYSRSAHIASNDAGFLFQTTV